MSKELYVSSTPHETKLAIVEEEQLVEVYFERENEYSLAGSIYKGKVTRVLPGMQSAFVDIGLERDAFLYVTDFMEEQEEQEDDLASPKTKAESPEKTFRRERREPRETEQAPQLEAATPQFALEGGFDGEQQNGSEKQAPAGDLSGVSARHETESHGTRRWRGRRGRRRGRFGIPERKFDYPNSGSTPAETESFREKDAAASTHPLEQQPTLTEQRNSRSAYEPMILPGESLSKYRRGGGAQESSEVASSESSAPEQAPPVHSITPSTEVKEIDLSQVSDWSALPGESLSGRRRGRIQKQRPILPTGVTTETAEPERLAESHGGLGDEQRQSQADESVGGTVPSTESPSQITATPASEQERSEEPAKPGFFASLFGRKSSAEPEQKAQLDSEFVRPSVGRESQEAKNQAGYNFAPGSGVVEEEVIEDEEFEIHNPHEALEDTDFEDYEEETLDHEPDELPAGQEVAEAVREAHVEERATGHHEAEGLGQEEVVLEGGAEFEDEDLQNRQADVGAPAGTAAFQQRTERTERRTGRFGRERYRRHGGGPRRNIQRGPAPMISELLKEGQEILVQIAKEPIAKKGARITSHIALPGRFLVYMPTVNHVGVSRKIASDEERLRLKRILLSEKGEALGGFIVRTAAAGASEDDLRADIRFLINLWGEIKQRSDGSKAPSLIYHDLNLVERILRDQVTTNFSHLWVDTEQEYERIVKFLSRFQPGLVKRVKLYTKETPLFEQFNIQEEINKALKSKVWLKSGGYIVINQTEALVAIDINTGKYVGKTARLEDTIVKTNIDAIREIVRQIRLRDLGGIIVIDFIDMDERKNRQKVMLALEEALHNDRAPSKVLQFNDFGLVAITRKRVKQSLERTLGMTCSYCSGTGMVKSPATVCNEIYVEMRKMAKHFEHDIMLRVNPEIVKQLKANGAKWLNEMEELTKRTIIVKSDPTLHQEQFDIQ